MPVPVLLSRGWPLLALASLLSFVPEAHAQRVSARDKVKIEALEQRMAAAEKRYADALVLVNNADPKGKNEGDAALEDMEDVISACVAQKGCQVSNLLVTYKRLLKNNADARDGDDSDAIVVDGARFHHVFDPRTGANPTTDVVSASVLADSAAIADALGTAFLVLGADGAQAIWPRLDAFGVRGALLLSPGPGGALKQFEIAWPKEDA